MLLTRHVFRPVIGKGKNPGASLWANTNFTNILTVCSKLNLERYCWQTYFELARKYQNFHGKGNPAFHMAFHSSENLFWKKKDKLYKIRLVVVRSAGKCVKFQFLNSSHFYVLFYILSVDHVCVIWSHMRHSNIFCAFMYFFYKRFLLIEKRYELVSKEPEVT